MAVKILILKEKNLKMLNLRSKLLKIIFIAFSFIFFGINSTFSMDSAPPIQNDQRYAKVVFLGYRGAGKTTLYNLLAQNLVDMNVYKHTIQLDYEILTFGINGKKVSAYLSDTSAEPRHKEIIEKFCEDAHIIFLVFDARDLVLNISKGTLSSRSKMDFENLIGRLNKIAPNCRVITIPTKLGLLTIEECPRIFFAKNFDEVNNYVNSIVETLEKTGKGTNPIDYKYDDLTLSDLTGEKAKEHRKKLYDIIVESLKMYGLENLPKEPKGFVAKIFEKNVYTQKKFLFWEYGKEEEDLSKSKISLVRPDGDDDEKKIYKSGKDTEKKVEYKQCVIF